MGAMCTKESFMMSESDAEESSEATSPTTTVASANVSSRSTSVDASPTAEAAAISTVRNPFHQITDGSGTMVNAITARTTLVVTHTEQAVENKGPNDIVDDALQLSGLFSPASSTNSRQRKGCTPRTPLDGSQFASSLTAATVPEDSSAEFLSAFAGATGRSPLSPPHNPPPLSPPAASRRELSWSMNNDIPAAPFMFCAQPPHPNSAASSREHRSAFPSETISPTNDTQRNDTNPNFRLQDDLQELTDRSGNGACDGRSRVSFHSHAIVFLEESEEEDFQRMSHQPSHSSTCSTTTRIPMTPTNMEGSTPHARRSPLPSADRSEDEDFTPIASKQDSLKSAAVPLTGYLVPVANMPSGLYKQQIARSRRKSSNFNCSKSQSHDDATEKADNCESGDF